MQKRRFDEMIGRRLLMVAFRLMMLTGIAVGQNVPAADTVRMRQLPDVEVVAQSRVPVARRTAPLQVLDAGSIDRLGLRDLSDAVRRFSGVTVKDYGGVGGLKTVSIRSLGAHHTAVSYDGVAIADAQSGQVDISRFTLDNVEMISLATGPNDDIFQTARVYASAGVLDIKTQKPRFTDGKTRLLSAKMQSGSFGWLRPVLSCAQKAGDRLSASLNADYMRADGKYPYTLVNGTIKTREKRVNSDIETFRLEGNLYGDLGHGSGPDGSRGTIETKLYAFHSQRGLPGSVKLYNKTATERLLNDHCFAQTQYRNRLTENVTLRAVAQYTYAYSLYRDVDDKYAAGFQEDRNTQQEYYASTGLLFTSSAAPLSASLTTDYAHTRLNNNFVNAAQPRRNTSLSAFAAQYRRRRLTLTASLLATCISDRTDGGDRTAAADDLKRLSPAIALSWQPFRRNALRLRASYKDIFRVPTFTDLYYLRMGNSDLKPEKAKQFNAGLTWSGAIGAIVRYLSLSVDGYRNRVEDKIVAFPTLYIWRMMNMGDVKISGADMNVSAEIPLSGKITATLSGSYTFQHAIDLTSPEAKNYRHQIPYTPRHTGNGSVAFETPWINVSWLLTAVGERYTLPQNTPANRVEAYAEQSLSFNRTFHVRNLSLLRLQAEIINLTDTSYDVIRYYPMPGRSWRLSMTFNL
jgi:outer membrane cobalamin receptor